MLKYIFAFICVFFPLHGSLSSLPWTKSFLETQAHFALQNLSDGSSNILLSVCTVTVAPMIDWQINGSFLLSHHSLIGGSIRVERQILSDLDGDPIALSFFSQLGISSRSKNSIFFEKAPLKIEVGGGIGKHLLIRKESYAQLFGYCYGGVGTFNAQWGTVTLGALYSFLQNHSLKMSMEYTRAFGTHNSFRGIGTIRTFSRAISFEYLYTRVLEWQLLYSFRQIEQKNLSTMLQIGFSLPF